MTWRERYGPWPQARVFKGDRMGWVERSYARFHRENVLIPKREAARYEARYGPVDPYPDVTAYDRGRMSAAEEDSSPDGLALHHARTERTPVCVRAGCCTLDSHEDTCPHVDD